MLLESLHTLVHTHLPRLTLDFARLQTLYTSRLDMLAGLVKRNKDLNWDKHQFAMVIELYGKLDQIKKAESIFRNMTQYTSAAPSVDIYNELLAVYVRRLRYVDDVTKKRFLSKMKTLESEMVRKTMALNTTSYNLLLAARIKAHDLQGAEKIFLNMTCPPDRITYNILLNGCLKGCRDNREKEIATQWMERLIGSGIAPNKKTFKSIMDGLADQVSRHARLGETHDMETTTQSVSNLYKVMLQLGHAPDTETVNTLLKCYTAANNQSQIDKVTQMLILPEKKSGCGQCGCGNKAVKTQEDDKSVKVKPDVFTFNMLMKHHLANNRTDQAFEAYDTMVQLDLCPDTVTYSNFIGFYAEQGNVSECLKYLDVMERKGIPSNNFIYNILLNCSLKYPEQAGKITPHLRSMLMNGTSTLDTVSQNIQLARYQPKEQEGLHESFEHYTDLLERNMYDNTGPVNTRTYNTILQSAGQFYKRAAHLPSAEERRGFHQMLDSIIASLDTSQIRSDLYTYALTIRNASYVGDMKKAESTYRSMLHAGIKPNQFIFSHLIYGYVSIGKTEKAHDILNHMSTKGFVPTAVNYAPLIKGYAESAEFNKAYELLREMLDNNVQADLVIYTTLASVFLDSPVQGNGKKAIDLLEGISKSGMAMDAASLTLLAEAYAIEAKSILLNIQDSKTLRQELTHHIAKIDSIYTTLKENQWLDLKAITTLLTAHNHLKNPEGVWKLWNELKASTSVTLVPHHYNAVIHGLTTNKTWYPVAKLVFEDMLHHPHVQPDASTLDLMIWGAYGVSDYDTIRTMWRQVHVAPLLVRSYYASMVAMLDQNQIEEARKVYEAYLHLPTPSPSSSTVWVGMINQLAIQHGLKTRIQQEQS
ncbi:uncharacterized protein B0P05DRAFT_521776 [Gilbertella persicaria]|uniref:uncharacterized protein n=1 Tax=Gilbertella persicaria TaxID=101096 RepID=UPI00221FCEEA|nr:uncharacterized protein B0P05DRAFT_521776 [Gilbertella persicaria]KAI8098395.1 hypothetical protein B0P05DRAFT_521776 [Gilbertella persicaria]